MQHTEELGFRDFSSFMVKEDRNNWVTLRVAFLYKGQLKHRESLQWTNEAKVGMQCYNLNLAIELRRSSRSRISQPWRSQTRSVGPSRSGRRG